MTNIILPENENNEEEETVQYQATEVDEQNFFLMYHMNLQPSEVAALDPEYRKWIIARFVAQKGMEREMMEQRRIMSNIGPTLKA